MAKAELVSHCRKRKLGIGGDIAKLAKRLKNYDDANEKRMSERALGKEKGNCQSCESAEDIVIVLSLIHI